MTTFIRFSWYSITENWPSRGESDAFLLQCWNSVTWTLKWMRKCLWGQGQLTVRANRAKFIQNKARQIHFPEVQSSQTGWHNGHRNTARLCLRSARSGRFEFSHHWPVRGIICTHKVWFGPLINWIGTVINPRLSRLRTRNIWTELFFSLSTFCEPRAHISLKMYLP